MYVFVLTIIMPFAFFLRNFDEFSAHNLGIITDAH